MSETKRREHIKENLDEFETKRKKKVMRDSYGGSNEFKKGCHARTNLVKDEIVIGLQISHNILTTCQNYFCQLPNIRGQFEKFVDTPYYPESELCGGAVTVSFSKYLP
jgi:hypothetical protein